MIISLHLSIVRVSNVSTTSQETKTTGRCRADRGTGVREYLQFNFRYTVPVLPRIEGRPGTRVITSERTLPDRRPGCETAARGGREDASQRTWPKRGDVLSLKEVLGPVRVSPVQQRFRPL